MNKKTTLLRVLVVASLGFTAPCAFTGNVSSRGGVAQIVGSENGADGITLASGQIAPMGVTGVNHPQPMDWNVGSIRIIPISGLSTASPHYGANKTNIMTWLKGGAAPTDRTVDPSAVWVLGQNFGPGDMILSSSPSFPLFNGQANPIGIYTGERGQRGKWCVVITNSAPFSASQVYFAIESSFAGLNLTGQIAKNSANGQEIPYQYILQGHWYGPDGIPNTADDVWYLSDSNPASSSTLVNELYYFGVTSSFSAGSVDDLNADKAVITDPNFYISCKYWVVDNSGATVASAKQALPVPHTLPVRPVLLLSRSGNGFWVHMQTDTGKKYVLEQAPRLFGPWTTVQDNFDFGSAFVSGGFDPGATFFRLRQMP